MPSATPSATDPFVGQVVVTVSDDLVVRSEPRVSDSSEMYKPWLPLGTELTVLDGPVSGSGYAWYRVKPISLYLMSGHDDGWVAAAGKDGEPWIALPGAAVAEPAGVELVRADVARPIVKPEDAKAAAASITAFGLDLYRALLADPSLGLETKNAVFSPTSIALALGMARAGARGETAAEMDKVLHAGGWEALGAGLNALDQALASRDATWQDGEGTPHQLALRIANAAFAQRGWAVVQDYLDAIAAAFGAGLRLVDYKADPEAARKAINAWVSQQTEKRIPELLGPGAVNMDNRLVLVNAIYLKANWQTEFERAATRSLPFTRLDGSRVSVPTMSQQDTIPYATGTGWKATELLYMGSGESPLAMTLILPDDLAAFEAKLTASRLAGIVGKLDTARDHLYDEVACEGTEEMICCGHPYDVRVFLPRFGIETRADLVGNLRSLSMDLATGPAADFSGITSPSELYIAAVIHQANIDVDEKGTEAAAATAVSMSTTGGCGSSQPAKVIALRLDRPFLFVLRDVETGAILFMGRVVDPSVGR
jgi:serpin B